MHDNSVIQVDLGAISHNMRVLRRIVGPKVAICPIVKADAYMLGAAKIARQLAQYGANMLAVYTPQQAAELNRAAITTPVLVLMPVRSIDRTDDLYRSLVAGRLHLAAHDLDHLGELTHIAERFGAVIPVHIEVDTGMSRGGAVVEEAAEMIRRVSQHRWLRLAGVFTHFAEAEGDQRGTDRQLAEFDAMLTTERSHLPADCLVHVGNTFATLRHRRYHRSMVRVGLAWAGYGLESMRGGDVIPAGEHLRPAVTWSSHIVHIKHLPPGATVGYGRGWTADRASSIGLVPVGYADGYPVEATSLNTADRAVYVALCREQDGVMKRWFCPVVGAVSMDQITIDLTDAPMDVARVGTRIEIITPDQQAPNHLTRLATIGRTIPHEMLCRLNPRLKRSYLHAPQPAVESPLPAAGKMAAPGKMATQSPPRLAV